MPRFFSTLFLALTLTFAVGAGEPVFALVKVFGNSMVFQRDRELPVWGTAAPGAEIEVTLTPADTAKFTAGAAKTQAGENGRWRLTLPAIKLDQPDLTPWTLTAICGDKKIAYTDILIGEVWHSSGQSNMQWLVKDSNNAKQEIADGNHPTLRYFGAGVAFEFDPQYDNNDNSSWVIATPETVGEFSAVAYYFAREINRATGFPVGVLNTSVGGMPGQTFVSEAKLKSIPELEHYAKQAEDNRRVHDATDPAEVVAWEQLKKKYDEEIAKRNAAPEAERANLPVPQRPSAKPGDIDAGAGGRLFNGMVAPIIGFPLRGVIWYQGEYNTGRWKEYRRLFPVLIEDWRERWGDEFSFYWAQLANFGPAAVQPQDNEWARLREAQSMTLSVPKTGQAVTFDIGDAKEIHPRNKQDVGLRLALIARHFDYGENGLEYSGPVFDSLKIDGAAALVKFTHVGAGLKFKDEKAIGFAIAGADEKFVNAAAKIIAPDTIALTAESVAAPVHVRYAWAGNTEVALENSVGLPAAPFRTDRIGD